MKVVTVYRKECGQVGYKYHGKIYGFGGTMPCKVTALCVSNGGFLSSRMPERYTFTGKRYVFND